MMEIEQELTSLLERKKSAPFLFLGSGFSKRYIELESWEGLLSKFCEHLKNYSYYKSKANGCIEESAKHLADDFFEHWWSHSDYEVSRSEDPKLSFRDSPLRYEIAKYLAAKTENIPLESLALYEELELLKECEIDGVITTNWDLLIEKIFPEYEVYKGQQDILYSNIMNIGEIYKIHGCCSDLDSMILTDDDYKDFNAKNAYLASKLITIFVEHPVIFIGYSLTDKNIKALLHSIALCSGQDNLEKLRDNLIFVNRLKGDGETRIENSSITIDNVQIPIRLIKTDDFMPIYQSLSKFQRKLPAHILRMCKERVYELVDKIDPASKISVIDYEKIDNFKDVEIVFGIGVTNQLGEKGYDGMDTSDLIRDVIFNDENYNCDFILSRTLPSLNAKTKFVPLFKYLKQSNILKLSSYPNDINLLKKFIGVKVKNTFRPFEKQDFYGASSSASKFKEKYSNQNFKDFLEIATEYDFVTWVAYFEDIDLSLLESYLQKNYAKSQEGSYSSPFRKIVVFYDWLRHGQELEFDS